MDQYRTVYFKDMIANSDTYTTLRQAQLGALLGADADGRAVTLDLDTACATLIAGDVGTGKSCLLFTVLVSGLLFKGKKELSVLLLDPKGLERRFGQLENVTYFSKADDILAKLDEVIATMDARYEELENRNLFCAKGTDMPHLLIAFDEISACPKDKYQEILFRLSRIAQLGRPVRIHILATTVTLLCGMQNIFPCRIMTATDSPEARLQLFGFPIDSPNGRGDAFLQCNHSPSPTRFQSAFLTKADIDSIYDHLMQ